MRTRTRSRGTTTSSLKDRIRKRAEERESYGVGGGTRYNLPEGVKFFTPKKGTMHLDILPYQVTADNHPEVPKGELYYQRTVWVHFNIGVEEKSYVCPRTIKQKCPICEEHSRLAKDPDADDKIVGALKAKERELFNVIDLDNESEGIQLWDISYHLFGKRLLEEIREGEEEWAGFSDLKGGYTLRVRFSEKSFGQNSFLEVSRIDFIDRDEDYGEDILKKVLDLDAILKIYSYSDLEKIFMGVDEDVEEPSEEPDEVSSEEEEEELEEKEPTKAPSPHSRRERREKKDRCPHGGKFGIDTDKLDECADCEIWEDCADRKDELAIEKKKG